MNRERFYALIDAYGSDPRRWPDDERAAAQALAARDESAAAYQRAAARLDEVLDESRPLAPSAALRSRVVQAAPRPARTRPRLGWLAPGAGLAAAGVAGLVFGATLMSPPEVQNEAVLAEAETYEVLDGAEPVERQL